MLNLLPSIVTWPYGHLFLRANGPTPCCMILFGGNSYGQPKYFGRKPHFPRECDMKSLPNARGDRIRVNIVLKYLKLCKDERTRNNCSIAKYIRGCSYLPKIFGPCVFHILLPRYFSLLLLKSLQEISVWRKSSPKSSNGSIAIACPQTFWLDPSG